MDSSGSNGESQSSGSMSKADKNSLWRYIDNGEMSGSKGVPSAPKPPTGYKSYNASGPSTLLKRRRDNQTVCESLDSEDKDHLDALIARMFYSSGLSFNLAKNPQYLKSFSFAADHKISGYVPPNFDKLRTTLLDQEKERIESIWAVRKTAWKDQGVTIVADGWSDPQRRPVVNFIAVAGGRCMFVKSVNCFGEVKDKYFIKDLMKGVIDVVGHQNVVQVITDNSSDCKGAGELIEGMYPHIYWTPSVVHTLDLALKDICDAQNVEGNQETYELCRWITEVYSTVLQIKDFVMNHNMRLIMNLKFPPLKLLCIPETRFASMVVTIKRFQRVRRALESMVISGDWSLFKSDDPVKAQYVKGTIVNDAWWDKLKYIVDFTAPIYDMMKVCDTDKSCLPHVYGMWDSMIKKVKMVIYKHEGKSLVEFSDFYEAVNGILVRQWEKSNRPLHSLAHSLNPRCYTDSWLSEDPTRLPPHMDAKISSERVECFQRLFSNVDHYNQAIAEYSNFSLKSAPFHDELSISAMARKNPLVWWANFGASFGLLQVLAIKVLRQPASSSCCERNWTTYSFIHSLERNGLTSSRAKDLIFVHNNLHLLSRDSEEYTNPNTKMWDVGGDRFESMGDIGVLEFAELSLDEPELEEELISQG